MVSFWPEANANYLGHNSPPATNIDLGIGWRECDINRKSRALLSLFSHTLNCATGRPPMESQKLVDWILEKAPSQQLSEGK
jgi:hypothetical protein